MIQQSELDSQTRGVLDGVVYVLRVSAAQDVQSERQAFRRTQKHEGDYLERYNQELI